MNDDLYVSLKIMALAREVRMRVEHLSRDIPYAIRQICMYVSEHPGCCQEDVSRQLMMDRSLLGRNVRKAQQMGLIERQVSPVDNRRAELFLSEKGKICSEETEKEIEAWQKAAMKDMNTSEKRQLVYLLTRLK